MTPVLRGLRWLSAGLAWLLVLVLVAAGAVAAGLRLTPMQTVTVAGQVVQVGTTSPDLSLSGPGELDLFGQSLPTHLRFAGPVRPRLDLTRISINSELGNFIQGTTVAGAQRVLGHALATGWTRYFAWETAITGIAALVLLGAVAGWRRLARRGTVALIAAGLAVAEGINLGAIMITAYRAPAQLRQVSSLAQLVGSGPPLPATHRRGRPLPAVQAVVMGDSTAAGAGLPPAAGASGPARSCGRSADAYAADLAASNGWQVLNVACDSATIRQGLLGPQRRGGRVLPPQFAAAQRARNASAVIVSVGADDLNWSAMLRYCAVAPRCDDRAAAAYFQQQLAAFSADYLQLLTRLAGLPSHPHVIINQYYDPFGPASVCLAAVGLTPPKLATLGSRLAALNAVLAKGAAQFGFTSVQPDFTGHQMCASQPYVQGLGAPAPFHPTELGQAAIALSDQAALPPASRLAGGG